jgi:hypothetical protein
MGLVKHNPVVGTIQPKGNKPRERRGRTMSLPRSGVPVGTTNMY